MENLTKAVSGIYIIKNLINNKCYIGSTSNFKSRCRSHRNLLNKNKHFNTHLQSAWNTYGADSFSFDCSEEIIKLDTQSNKDFTEILNRREEFYIQQYKAANSEYGYNARVECSTNLGLKWSEESKKKFSLSKKGKPLPENTLKAVIAAAKRRIGIPNPSLSKWMATLTEEQRHQFYSDALGKARQTLQQNKELTGSCFTKEMLQRMRQKRGYKSVFCYKLTGEFVKEFPTISAAQQWLGNSRKNTSSIKSHIDFSIYCNYFWSFNYKPFLDYTTRKRLLDNTNNTMQLREVVQYDLNYNYVKTWYSMQELATYLGYRKSTPIREAILKHKSLKGFYFEYNEAYKRDLIGKPEELLENLEIDNQQPSLSLTTQEGSETNS